MTVKICTSEYMLGTVDGLGMARHFFPRVCAEAFLQSTKDGPIKRAPDPVTLIEGNLTYYNNTDDPQMITVQVVRAPRSIVAQSPNTVIIHDAWSWATGVNPNADYPSVNQDTFGGKMQIDRPSAAPADLLYGRFFLDGDTSQAWVNCGELAPQYSFQFRYLAAVQTPGVWTAATAFEPDWEADARWVRLLAFATPVGSS